MLQKVYLIYFNQTKEFDRVNELELFSLHYDEDIEFEVIGEVE